MKVPSGTPLLRGFPLFREGLKSFISSLSTPFNGYLAFTGLGYEGMEEGMLLVEGDSVTHAYYVHLKYLYEERGDGALEKVLNVIKTEGAVADAVELTVPKLKLTASFNEDARLSKPIKLKDLPAKAPASYSRDTVIKIIRLLPSARLERVKRLMDFGLIFGRREDI